VSQGPRSQPRSGRPLTGRDIAWCGQADPNTRARWARDGRLKKDGPWTSHDAAETAIAFAIPDGFHATTVWDAIRPQVRGLLLAGKEDAVWLVLADHGGDHRAVPGAAAAARAVRDLGVLCRLVEARPFVQVAKERFLLKSEQAAQGDGVVHAIRKRGTG
jgi:hypothetical protein